MLCLGAVSFVAGVVFLLMGAWPVFGFFGLDVLLRLSGVPGQFPPRARLREDHGDRRPNCACARSAIAATCANGCSIRSGCGSTATCTRNSASRGCFWSRTGGGCRSRVSRSGRKGKLCQSLNGGMGEAKRGPTLMNPVVSGIGWCDREIGSRSSALATVGLDRDGTMMDLRHANRPRSPDRARTQPNAALRDYDVVRRAIAFISRATGARSRRSKPWRKPPASRRPNCTICFAAGPG